MPLFIVALQRRVDATQSVLREAFGPGAAAAFVESPRFAFELIGEVQQRLALVLGVAGGDDSAALRAQA
jgi:hypothetical protein